MERGCQGACKSKKVENDQRMRKQSFFELNILGDSKERKVLNLRVEQNISRAAPCPLPQDPKQQNNRCWKLEF